MSTNLGRRQPDFVEQIAIAVADSPYAPTALHSVQLLVDTSGGAVTINFPAISALNHRQRIEVVDEAESFEAYPATPIPNGSDTIEGDSSAELNLNGIAVTFEANNRTKDWKIV